MTELALFLSLWLATMPVAFMFSMGCCCDTCTTVRNITSWGADSTTIGQGATEQNGNWEILSGKLRVATADAIITWDAGITEWSFYFDTGAMSWNIPGSTATDYTKELRFIFNWVDNSNYDYVSLRKTAAPIYLASFGQRVAGVDTVILPVAGGGGAISAQFAINVLSTYFSAVYKDEVLHLINESGGTCGNGSIDRACNGRSWYRPRVSNIVGIGTGPTWTGNVDIGNVGIGSPATTACSSVSGVCLFPTLPACGATNRVVANSITATIAGTPYTLYPDEANNSTDYNWSIGSGGSFKEVILKSNGDITVASGATDTWTLTNGGSPRTDADAWSGLNIPPDAPNVQTCTLTGNY